MNVELYKMIKASLFAASSCPDGPEWGFPCRSCMAEAVTNMLEDEYTLTSKWHSVPLEEV